MKKILILFFIFASSVFSKEYKRIIIMAPSMFEVACLLDVEDRVVGVGELAGKEIYPVEKSKDIPRVGNAFRPSVEKIIAQTPDLVIVNEGVNFPIRELRSRGINVVGFSTKRIEDTFNNIEKFGKLVGKEKKAEEVIKKSKLQLKNIAKIDNGNLKGIFIYSTSPLMAFTDKSLPGDILNVLGVKNIGADLVGGRPVISPEFLLKENPDFIVGIMTVNSVQNLEDAIPMLEHTNAGKNHDVFIFDAELIYRNSPRMLEGVEELAQRLKKIKK
ncbi:ABC transporter substrate-binding protein [Fusobacterium sp.]|uniref:ABC transporter substrate-binding protein n=1 Tax=Fusobacterium sp. TaxID=68766 RepID=UPI00396C4E76